MLIKIAQLILSLSLLVIIHELGHFIFARVFGCRVERFYLFFNPWFSIFKFKKGDTEYGMGWIPFGGYVSISGMIDESMNTEQMKEPAKPYEFRSKPAWQRLLIMVGGVMMNVVLAICIYIGLSYAYGESYISVKDAKYGFECTELAEEVGFRDGDKILTIDGKPVDNYREVVLGIVLDGAREVGVERNGVAQSVVIDEKFIPQILKAKTFIEPMFPFVMVDVNADGNAAKAGLAVGDTIVAIDGVAMLSAERAAETIFTNGGKTLNITVARDSAGLRTLFETAVAVTDKGKIGVAYPGIVDLLTVSTREYTLLSAIPAGLNRSVNEINNYLKQLKLIFTPETEAYKSVGGFIAIGNIFPDTWSWYSFWNITALLSVMLAIMNLLPIPALDGGHVMFLLYEVITRRRPSDKFMERAQVVGMMLLLALLIYANGNDIVKLFMK